MALIWTCVHQNGPKELILSWILREFPHWFLSNINIFTKACLSITWFLTISIFYKKRVGCVGNNHSFCLLDANTCNPRGIFTGIFSRLSSDDTTTYTVTTYVRVLDMKSRASFEIVWEMWWIRLCVRKDMSPCHVRNDYAYYGHRSTRLQALLLHTTYVPTYITFTKVFYTPSLQNNLHISQ